MGKITFQKRISTMCCINTAVLKCIVEDFHKNPPSLKENACLKVAVHIAHTSLLCPNVRPKSPNRYIERGLYRRLYSELS